MSVAALPHARLMRAIEIIGSQLLPLMRDSSPFSQAQR